MKTSSLYKTRAGEQAVQMIYETALKHWPVPCETRTIPSRHGETFVVASGDAASPALILLHGAGGNSSMWAQDVGEYSQHFRVYAVDLLGEAGKSSANRPDWEGPAFAEWLEDVFTGLNIEKATLVGISQGAWTALKFAVAMPDRVERLVLMAPGGIMPDRTSFILRVILWKLMGASGIRRMVNALLGDQVMPQDAQNDIVSTLSQFQARLGLLPRFTDEELRRLTMPVILIGGAKDIMRDMTKIETRLRLFVPHLKVKIIPGAGHILLNTRECVMEFLMR
jgi:pimeloyl-ACP methyl ester carboxylesterase